MHNLIDAIAKERLNTNRVLKMLLEVESRGVHLSRGYSSMFAFCVQGLGYSEPEALLRIRSMRLMRDLPLASEEFECGQLSMTVMARAERCFARVEQTLGPIDLATKNSIILELRGLTAREAERKLVAKYPISDVPIERERPIGRDLTVIEFTASDRLLGKLNRLKGLLAHKNFEGRYDLLFEELADRALATLDPSYDAGMPCSSVVADRAKKTITGKVRRHVWRVAEGRCQYVDPVTHRRCDSNYALQIDHIVERRAGGKNHPSNLRLLCGAHNRHRNRRIS